ncbi:hypothetical protein [Actinophytocola sp.]|uniref:hypothetical protein n=1 Tax=Actinophytocola sp. TaxID=1872138 RepID=UPI002ED8AE00
MTDDPERLVAEALRAHAARTPLPGPEHTDLTSPVLGSYGLLSGSGMRLPPADPPTVRGLRVADRTTQLEPEGRIAVGWVILLALLLGLAAGAVVGLLTLL